MKVKVSFHNDWLMGGLGLNMFAAQDFAEAVEEKEEESDFKVVTQSSDAVEMSVKGNADRNEISRQIRTMIQDSTGAAEENYDLVFEGDEAAAESLVKNAAAGNVPEGNGAAGEDAAPRAGNAAEQVNQNDEAAEEIPRGSEAVKKTESSTEAEPDSAEGERGSAEESGSIEAESGSRPEKDALTRIDELIGSDQFKALCHQIAGRAPVILKHHTENVFHSDTFLFCIDKGSGLTNSLNLMSDLLKEQKLTEDDLEVQEIVVPRHDERMAPDPFDRMIASLPRILKNSSVTSFDITDWLDDTGDPEFKHFLMLVFSAKKEGVVVFRTPLLSQTAAGRVKEDIGDILNIHEIDFEPFSREQTHEIAKKALGQYGFHVQDSAWDIFDERVDEEKSDGYFYGIHTIEKIANDMISRAEASGQQTEDLEISAASIADLAAAPERAGKDPEEELADLTGLASVKQTVSDIVNQIVVARTQGLKISPSMNMRFEGNPGTGKTTVARIVARILKEKGVLRIGNLYEYHGRDLVGQYVGHTADKTKKICEKAYGSVLFIDEAYSLDDGQNGSNNNFGREAIDTLIAQMENHQSDLVVILAGYTDDMERLMYANQGLKSRIPYLVMFPNYSREELTKIYLSMIPETLQHDEAFDSRVSQYFAQELPDDLYRSKEFGNGRFCRNLYERTWSFASRRYAGKEPTSLTLLPEDFDAAVKSVTQTAASAEKKRRIGF